MAKKRDSLKIVGNGIAEKGRKTASKDRKNKEDKMSALQKQMRISLGINKGKKK